MYLVYCTVHFLLCVDQWDILLINVNKNMESGYNNMVKLFK